jgi:hypothetical protein
MSFVELTPMTICRSLSMEGKDGEGEEERRMGRRKIKRGERDTKCECGTKLRGKSVHKLISGGWRDEVVRCFMR